MRALVAVTTTLVFVATLGAFAAWSDARVIEGDIWAPLPLEACDLPGLVHRIAMDVRQPAGIESSPGACPRIRNPKASNAQWRARGLTVRDALNQLIRLDPRYGWADDNGVIVVRPVDALSDADDVLQRTIPTLAVSGARLSDALDTLVTALGPWQVAGLQRSESPQFDHRFSLSMQSPSVLEALDAVVRVHGASVWTIEYCKPQRRFENVSIGVSTFDGYGVGWHPASIDNSGRRYDACSSAR
jgi:hypothetical protein